MRKRHARRNPLLAVYGNPRRRLESRYGSDLIAKHICAIIYVHAEDGEVYVHGFGHEPTMEQRGDKLILSNLCLDSNVRAVAQRDGSVRLVHADGLNLWGEY